MPRRIPTVLINLLLMFFTIESQASHLLTTHTNIHTYMSAQSTHLTNSRLEVHKESNNCTAP